MRSEQGHLDLLLTYTLKQQFLTCEELSGQNSQEVLKEAINFYLRALSEIESHNKILFTRPDGTTLWVGLKKNNGATETVQAPEKSGSTETRYCCNCRFSIAENPLHSSKRRFSCINEEVLKKWNTRDPLTVEVRGADLIEPRSVEDQFDSISCDLAREEKGYYLDSCGLSAKFYEPKEG